MPTEKLKRSQYFIPPTTECPHTSRNHFEDWEEYHLPAARMHHTGLHDWGVAEGLEIGVDGSEIEVQPGTAVDINGELIVLSESGEADVSLNEPGESGQRIGAPFRMDTTGREGQTLYVTIQFAQTPRLGEGSCGKLEQTPWLRLQPAIGDGTLASHGIAIVMGVATVDDQGAVTVVAGDAALAHRRRLLGQRSQSVRIDRATVVEDVVDDVPAAEIASGDEGGLRVSLADAASDIVLVHELDGQFANFEVHASTTRMAGDLEINGELRGLDRLGVAASAPRASLSLGLGDNEDLLQFDGGGGWKFTLSGSDVSSSLDLQALTSNRSFRVLAADGAKTALQVRTSNTAAGNAVYLAESGGRVGIGTSAPTRNLTIDGGATAFVNLRANEGAQELMLGIQSTAGLVATSTDQDLQLRAGNRTGMTVKTDGNIGIGTSSPAEKLHVEGRIQSSSLSLGGWPASTSYVFFGANTLNQGVSANYALLQQARGSGVGTTFLNSPREIRFRIANSDRMFLANNGNVGIRTTAPDAPLHVVGGSDVSPGAGGTLVVGSVRSENIAMDGNEIMARNNGRATTLHLQHQGGNVAISHTGGGRVGIGTNRPTRTLDVRGDIRATGRLFVHDVPFRNRRNMQWDSRTFQFCQDDSTLRHKDNVRPLRDDFHKLLGVEPKTYTRPDHPDHWEIGCIAEEFHAAGLERLVFYDRDGTPEAINYEKISLYLLEIVKDLHRRLAAWEKRVSDDPQSPPGD